MTTRKHIVNIGRKKTLKKNLLMPIILVLPTYIGPCIKGVP